jgi:hypothetical protein
MRNALWFMRYMLWFMRNGLFLMTRFNNRWLQFCNGGVEFFGALDLVFLLELVQLCTELFVILGVNIEVSSIVFFIGFSVGLADVAAVMFIEDCLI